MKLTPWQVWWFRFDPTEGHEQGRTRPAIVVSSAHHLRLTGAKLITVVPMTSRTQSRGPHWVSIHLPGHKPGWAMTEQVRTMSTSRIVGGVVATLNPDEIEQVRLLLGDMFAF